jgi:hypothetical protein
MKKYRELDTEMIWLSHVLIIYALSFMNSFIDKTCARQKKEMTKSKERKNMPSHHDDGE